MPRAVVFALALWVAAALLPAADARAQAIPDPGFDTSVARPAHSRRHPVVVVDEAHANYHTAEGRYRPFAELLRSDGYRVVRGTKAFSKRGLRGVDVLVVSNAMAPDATAGASAPAFTERECDAVRDWVRAGGSLLLIADHAPFGSAAGSLGERFGVDMGDGFVHDRANVAEGDESGTLLVFSRENGLLGDHPITRGRDASEEVQRVAAFTGQSLGVPAGAATLLKLGPGAVEAPSRADLEALKAGSESPGNGTARPVGGRAQGIALEHGKGRVVVLGEAAMASAQLIRLEMDGQQQEFKMGMNVPGNDDRQFVLNVVRWLSGALE